MFRQLYLQYLQPLFRHRNIIKKKFYLISQGKKKESSHFYLSICIFNHYIDPQLNIQHLHRHRRQRVLRTARVLRAILTLISLATILRH